LTQLHVATDRSIEELLRKREYVDAVKSIANAIIRAHNLDVSLKSIDTSNMTINKKLNTEEANTKFGTTLLLCIVTAIASVTITICTISLWIYCRKSVSSTKKKVKQ
jgi:hypothetical protein